MLGTMNTPTSLGAPSAPNNSGINGESVVRWTARLWSIASTFLLLAFAFGGREHLRFTAAEALLFLTFPVGIIAGFAVAWRRELAGGLITVGSLALFYLLMLSRTGRWPGPLFLLFAAPSFLHLLTSFLTARRAPARNEP